MVGKKTVQIHAHAKKERFGAYSLAAGRRKAPNERKPFHWQLYAQEMSISVLRT